MSILENVIMHKQREVEKLHEREQAGELVDVTAFLKGKVLEDPHSFKKALEKNPFNIIAEIKRSSPSKGEIARIEDPAALAKQYELGGASALSVLTDKKYFGGSLDDLCLVKQVTSIPILRKDFIIDEIQIAEAASKGASCVLLIVKALKDRTKKLLDFATKIGMDALIEVHNTVELEVAIEIKAEVLGVNNRDLDTFHTDIETSLKLAPIIPHSMIRVSESSITSAQCIRKLKHAGYNAALIGQALVESKNPRMLIKEFLQAAEND